MKYVFFLMVWINWIYFYVIMHDGLSSFLLLGLLNWRGNGLLILFALLVFEFLLDTLLELLLFDWCCWLTLFEEFVGGSIAFSNVVKASVTF